MSSPVHKHREKAPEKVRFAVIVTSDSLHERAVKGLPVNDETGDLMEELVSAAGHVLVHRVIVPNDRERLVKEVEEALAKGAEIVLVSGGTGLGPRDISVDTLTPLLERCLPGFGELFRYLSFEEVGSAAMLSRASAGIYRGSVLFILPGSPHAARLALTKLILPEAGHLVAEVKGVR
ncbi:MAG: molybdenum cofactor biosynthesis protein [Thermoprotei archaeon]|nr:MAG: molybdenum cofactor biosynthesis protein [Thermoprotei archaeon]